MPKNVLITRPLPFAERTAVAVAALGYRPHISPLLKIVSLPVPAPTETFGGAILSSASVFELASRLPLPADMPLYVVGEQTADVAHKAGFNDVRHCALNALALAEWLNSQSFPKQQGLIHYRGVHQAQDLAKLLDPVKFSLTSVPVYDMYVQPLSPVSIQLLRAGAVHWILLYSRRTSEALATALEAMEDLGWISKTGLLCLSSAVSEPLYGFGWRDVQVATVPTEAAMQAVLQGGG